jgi:hypothetical protein
VDPGAGQLHGSGGMPGMMQFLPFGNRYGYEAIFDQHGRITLQTMVALMS